MFTLAFTERPWLFVAARVITCGPRDSGRLSRRSPSPQ